MIILDTHIWVWWVHGNEQLTQKQSKAIQDNEDDVIGVSANSCWEVAKLVEVGRLGLSTPVEKWIEQAMGYPGIRLLDLSPEISIESTRLPGEFHRDPADQIIVATARIYNCPLLTADGRIIEYPYVKTIY
jgi:PIN domain nuclease of toxin-antitoxin system